MVARIPACGLLLAACCLLLSSCQQKMAGQPSYKPLEPSAFFGDERSARPLVRGTVARGYLRSDAARFRGMNPPDGEGESLALLASREGDLLESLADNFVDTFPFAITDTLMKRGQQRYMIYCVVCHDPLGTGRGKIVERGYTPPPSLHLARLRGAPAGHFYDVISNGYGSMPSYAAQVPPDDRWAIAAYIRALQLSQHLTRAQLAPEDRDQLTAQAGGGQQP